MKNAKERERGVIVWDNVLRTPSRSILIFLGRKMRGDKQKVSKEKFSWKMECRKS